MTETFQPVDLLAIVLALAVLIGCIDSLWIKLPPAIGLLLGLLVVSVLIVSSDYVFHLHVMSWFRGTLDSANLPRVVLNAVLALLLFAGSLHVDVSELNRRRGVILMLATASVMIAMLIFGAGMWVMFGLIGMAVPLIWCFVLGAILAPTDAVVVETLLQRVALPEGLGGAARGFVTGWLAALLMRRIADEGLLLLISLTLVLGSYRIANVLELSGPIAVVSAGLCLVSPSPRFGMAQRTRAVLLGFWTLLDQLLNTMLFLLVGLQILGLVIAPAELIPIVFAIPLAVLARLIRVAVPILFSRDGLRDKARNVAVLTWAGLRGGISIALALTLPASPWRADLLVVTYAVVVFTIVVQGLTMPRFLRAVDGAKEPA